MLNFPPKRFNCPTMGPNIPLNGLNYLTMGLSLRTLWQLPVYSGFQELLLSKRKKSMLRKNTLSLKASACAYHFFTSFYRLKTLSGETYVKVKGGWSYGNKANRRAATPFHS